MTDVPLNFDPVWYVENYPDVADIGMDPAEHYAWIGGHLGRAFNAQSVAASLSMDKPPGWSAPKSHESPAGQTAQQVAVEVELPEMPIDPLRWSRFGTHVARHRPVPLAPLFHSFNPNSMNLHWIVSGELPPNSQQTRVFSLIRHLQVMGHKNWVWVQPPFGIDEPAFRLALGPALLGSHTILRRLPEDVIGISGDAVIATDFWSCYPAAAMPLFKARFRLAQHNEADCQIDGGALALAKRANSLDFMVLCAGSELRGAFEGEGAWARDWPECADGQFFYPDSVDPNIASQSRPVALAVDLGPVRSNLIAVDLTLDALGLLAQRDVNFVAHVMGQTPVDFDPSYPVEIYGILGPAERGDLYRKCRIGLSISAGLDRATESEMLACGMITIGLGPVADRQGIKDRHVVDASPTDVADKIASIARQLTSHRTNEQAPVTGCHMTAQTIEAGLKAGLKKNNNSVPIATAIATAGYEHKASVIIPTWNGGVMFRNVLETLAIQSTPWSYDIMVVDSGSSDETLEITRSFADRGVRLHQIPNSEFQHGRTRNLAISMTSSEFVAVLTQDATPADQNWLANLVKAFDTGPRVAGVFGAHRAYADANPYVSMGIQGHFDHFAQLPTVAHWDAHETSIPFGSVAWQNWAHYYSDNNSCMRRSVWEHIPYPDIDWGEDQVWAWEIIKQGYEKSYAHDAIVYHSHNLDKKQQRRVAEIEGEFWLRYFNYTFECSIENVVASTTYVADRDRKFALLNNINDTVAREQIELNTASITSRYSSQARFLLDLYRAYR